MRIRFVMTVLMLLGLGGALKANAQNWTGNAPSNLLTVLFYNVGSKCYLSGGNYWGTQVTLLGVGQYFTLSSQTDGYRIYNGLTTSGSYIGFGASSESSEMYVNGSSNGTGISDFSFNAVSGKSNVYTISCTNVEEETVYLKGNGQNNAVGCTTVTPSDTDEDYQWILVTKANVQAYFDDVANVTKLGSTSIDATYLIGASTFPTRGGELSKWVTSSGASITQPAASGKTVTYLPSKASANSVVIGNGYGGETVFSSTQNSPFKEDADLLRECGGLVNTTTKCEKYFGGLWTANIHGKESVQQTITVKTSGWYEFACLGFTTGTAELYATTTSAKDDEKLYPSSATNTLTTIAAADAPATYALAAVELRDGEGYRQSVSIYVEVPTNGSANITFGVRENGSTGWACFDDFQLTYFGKEVDKCLYFDETNTEVSQLENQVDKTSKHTMYLRRSLKSDQWNSLMLPVTLTRDQILAAFGPNTILSELEGVDKNNSYRINFTPVDLTDADTELKANRLYIIKPMGGMSTLPDGDYSLNYVNTANTDDGYSTAEFTVKDGSPVVIRIPNIAYTQYLGTDDGVITQDEGYNFGAVLDALVFKGTYVNKVNVGNIIPEKSFVIGADGVWYYTNAAINNVKGFRTWIDTTQLTAEARSQISFSINGVVDGGVTAIDGVVVDKPATPFSQNVYDLNGRIVNAKGNVDGLAKGIYIVNGKKVVIK